MLKTIMGFTGAKSEVIAEPEATSFVGKNCAQQVAGFELKRVLLWIIALDTALAISSTIVDWPWLMRVPRHLLFFAPICSLYPWLLAIWFILSYLRIKKPVWFTTFIFMGIVSYGIMAWIYFPFYMSWTGINFHDTGSIFWVSLYAVQALFLVPEIKKMPYWQYALVFGYFFFKDYADRYLGTFLDVLLDNYPENLKLLFGISIVSLHVAAAGLVLYLGYGKKIVATAWQKIQEQVEVG